MSMANSLEVRSPLLDHKVIEYAARIPSSMKMKYGNKKHILKEAFKRILPEEILKRKKHGFDVPLNRWFQNELKEISEESLFNNKKLEFFFNIDFLKHLWIEHQKNKINHGTIFWTALIFSLWLENDSYDKEYSYN
jgi:asparagine synthase (glutamine-hydrolysing)